MVMRHAYETIVAGSSVGHSPCNAVSGGWHMAPLPSW